MDKRILQRKSGKLIAAAAAATAGLVGWGTQHADASLVIDLRATGISHDGGNTVLPIADPKAVVAAQGDRVYFSVVARLSGTNATQLTGNFDALVPASDTKNDDTLQIVTGSFSSTGALKGNYDPTNVGPAQGTTPPSGSGAQISPFNAAGAVNGQTTDWDSDGDLDIGNAGTDTSTMWSSRAAAPNAVTKSQSSNAAFGTRFGWSTGTTFNQDTGPNSQVSLGKLIDATTSEATIGEMDWVVTGTSGTALLNFIGRPATDPGSALWFEDGSSTGKTPGTGAFLSGAPITVSVPEPASLGLLGIAGLGLLARRKKH